MTSLEQQTAVEKTGEGTYRADISTDWKMWVPVGGYLTAIALRAAEASSTMIRPVSVSCHYLNEATFGPADLEVTTLQTSERAESLLERMSQNGTDVLVALVSAAPTGQLGPQVNWQPAPAAPEPDELGPTILDEDVIALMGDEPYWKNLEFRMITGLMGAHDYPDVDKIPENELRFTPRRDAHVRGWRRMEIGENLSTPWADACRYLIIAAGMQFPVVADPVHAAAEVHRADAQPHGELPHLPPRGSLDARRRGGLVRR